MKGRPMTWRAKMSQMICRCSSLFARSVMSVGQVGVLAQRGLDQNGNAVLLQPMLVRRDHAGPGPAAAAAHLPALDGEIDLVPARITGGHLQFRSEQRVEQLGELVGICGCAAASDHQFLAQEILKPSNAGRVPCHTDADLVIGAADPGELPRVELGGLRAQQRIERDAARNRAECGAVAGRDVVEPVRQPDAAGTLHVLGNDRRISRDMPSHVPGDHPGIDVVPAAHAVADIEVDGPALEEIGRRLSAAAIRASQQHHGGDGNLRDCLHSAAPFALLGRVRARSLICG